MQPLLSICIPSYNRPEQLLRLLSSIDCETRDIDIIVCEDNAPLREKVRSVVTSFKNQSSYRVHYFENKINLGYDANIRRLVERATGRFVMFMGDDDKFIPNTLNQFLSFLYQHEDKKYILRSYIRIHPGNRIENFRYLPKSMVLPPGEKTVAWLFKRSVSIAGFTISRDESLKFSNTDLDGTLLYQIYLMAQVCLYHESIYCDIPVAECGGLSEREKPMFGSSVSEKSRYIPGSVTMDNSINFYKAYFELTDYLDKIHGTHLTNLVKIDVSKYSYHFLTPHRNRGLAHFLQFAKRVESEIGMGCTPYYFIYKWGLALFGQKFCERQIICIKNVIGHTPNF